MLDIFELPSNFFGAIQPMKDIVTQLHQSVKDTLIPREEQYRKALWNALEWVYKTTFNEALHRVNVTFNIYEPEESIRIPQNIGQSFVLNALNPENAYSNESVKEFEKICRQFLTQSGVLPNDQGKVFRYVGRHFNARFFELLEEGEKQKFSLLTGYLNSKQAEEHRKIYLRNCYEQKLMKLFESDAVFQNENLSLKKLYVPPHFSLHNSSVKQKQSEEYLSNANSRRREEYFPLEKNLDDCLLSILQHGQDAKDYLKPDPKNKRSRFLLILGSPGQGKSSLCKRLMYNILTGEQALEQEVFFIRMRYITERIANLCSDPLGTLLHAAQEQVDVTDYRIDEAKFKQSLLVLDGFDELSMANNMESQDSIRFCTNLIEKLEFNTNLRIILTSRLGRISPQDIHSAQEKVNIFLMQPFNQEQQQQWLRNYTQYEATQLTKKQIAECHQNTDDKYNHILELLGQPLLLHILATLKTPITEIQSNKAAVYDKLFGELIARNYDSGAIRVYQDHGIDDKKLRKIIQELAFAIFQSGQDFIHKDAVLKIGLISNTFQQLQSDNKEEAVFKGLLVSFYLNEALQTKIDAFGNTTNNFAIEFLHKSLQEYMAAEKVWRSIRSGLTDKQTNDGEEQYRIKTTQDILGLCAELFTQRFFTKEIGSNIEEIIENDTDNKTKALVFQRLKDFLPTVLQHGFLNNKYNNALSPVQQSLNGFAGYCTVLAALANGENFIEEQSKGMFAEFLRLWSTSTAYYSCHKFSLRKQDLSNANLIRANLSGARLIEAHLSGAKLYGAYLPLADLSGADLRGADLERAGLRGADLERADLRGADLHGADLYGVDLYGADLRGADLRGADLREANLHQAIMYDVKNLSHRFREEAIKQGAVIYPTDSDV